MTTAVATCNLRYTLDAAAFEHGLRQALHSRPDLVALQEAGPNRDPLIQKVAHDLGYAWTRAKGGGVVLWRADRYRLRACKPIRLAGAELVGHLPGRKDRLPASICTEVLLDDLETGRTVVVEDYHMTAEVQMGSGYRRDLKHRLRVMRHKREKRRLGRRSRMHQRRDRTVYPAGDGNFDGMALGGFVNCWTDRSGGDLGGRAVSIIFAARKPLNLWTVVTPSDHKTVLATYKEKP
jgi:hypothetical protein